LSDPKTNDEFSELLLQARSGDTSAQTRLCQEYERQVYIVVRVILGPLLRPHLDSIDLVQSVHRSLLAGLRDKKFEIATPQNLVALACTMVRRKVARKWRSHRRQSASLPSDSQLLSTTLRSLYSREDSPENLVEYDDSLEKLCESLTPIERIMLERKLEGYTTGEVAKQLGMHPVTVRVRWSRLRDRLAAQEIFLDGI
jgi:RNA polymerase sigma-70 factor (ECF subfamily)